MLGTGNSSASRVGPYPHAELHAMTNGRKKQGARLIKCECPECGYIARVARQWIDDQGAPHCPSHGEMTVARLVQECEHHGTPDARILSSPLRNQ